MSRMCALAYTHTHIPNGNRYARQSKTTRCGRILCVCAAMLFGLNEFHMSHMPHAFDFIKMPFIQSWLLQFLSNSQCLFWLDLHCDRKNEEFVLISRSQFIDSSIGYCQNSDSSAADMVNAFQAYTHTTVTRKEQMCSKPELSLAFAGMESVVQYRGLNEHHNFSRVCQMPIEIKQKKKKEGKNKQKA